MELRHLKYFKTVAEELSFSEAAKKLFVAQPAISQQISDLEKELGVSLFHRSKRQVILTPAGNILYKHVNNILDQVEIAAKETVRASKGQVGELVIGFIGTPVHQFMPDLINSFKDKYDGVKISLEHMNPEKQVQALINNEIQVSFSRPINNSIYPQLESHLVYTDSFVAALRSDHPLAQKDSLTPEDLVNEPLILLSRKSSRSYFELMLSFFNDIKRRPEIFAEPEDLQTMMTLVLARCGIAIVPSCAEHTIRDDIKLIPLRPDSIKVDLCMHWNKEQDNVIAEAFIELAKEVEVKTKVLA